ncbi:MAG: DUF6785 family protein [Candidatus Latescibacterota bacterium]
MASSPTGRRALSVRSLAVGAVLSLCIALGDPYATMVLRGSYLALDFTTPGAVFLFFLLVGLLNRLAGRLSPALALDRGELLVTYAMMIAASSVSTMGLSAYLLPILASSQYFATPENEWGQHIQPHVPAWMAVQDAAAITGFFEGSPRGQGVPWAAWIAPLCTWGVFLVALFLVMAATVVLLHRQWAERERLIYPIVQVPLEMVQEGAGQPLGSPFFRSKVMWAGFALPAAIGTLRALHAYYSFVPGAELVAFLPLFRNQVDLQFRLSFPMVGFTYLINLEVAFSLWFFNLLGTGARGAMRVLGVSSTEELGPYGAGPEPILAHQGMGALVTLVLVGLWVGRRHFREALAGRAEDRGQAAVRRAALRCWAGGVLAMAAWLWMAGLPAWASLALVLLALLVFVGLTRIVAEGGAAEITPPLVPAQVLVSAVGTTVLGPSGVVALAFSYVWAGDIRTFLMVACAHGLKLGEQLGERLWTLVGVVLLAALLSFAASVAAILYLSYQYGGINLNAWFFGDGCTNPFTFAAHRLANPAAPSVSGWLHTGAGAGLMGLLVLARHRLPWWPLHPLGFPIAVVWSTNQVWFSIFVAWLLKLAVLRYGGPRLYRASRPFFIGLIAGQATIAGLWLVVDHFTGMTDNLVFWM